MRLFLVSLCIPHLLCPIAAHAQQNVAPQSNAPRQQQSANAPLAAPLTVLPAPGADPTAAPQPPGSHDFGAATLLDQRIVERTFTLRNDGAEPLKLTRIHASCGCTSAVVQTGVGPVRPDASQPTLKPGERTQVRVTLDLSELPPGPVHKVVSVYAEGRPQPVALLQMRGTLLPAVRFSPAALDFGIARGADGRSFTLSATLDARLAPGGVWPTLIASHPAVRLQPLPDAVAANAKPADGAPAAGPATVTRRWNVSLAPDAALDAFSGTISFAAPARPATTGIAPGPAAAPGGAADPAVALASAAVRYFGKVEGDVRAEPQAVSFGSTAAGATATQKVVLTGKTASALEGAKAASAGAHVAARLEEPTISGGQATRTLVLTLSPTAPAGPLQTEVKVTLSGGQRLLIPVRGYVAPGGASANR